MKSLQIRKRAGTLRLLFAVWVVVLTGGFAARAGEFHVRTNGSPSGDGSSLRPWDIRTALSDTMTIGPGDTVWLHGGTYQGTFESFLRGTPASPVVVRSYPGEWAVIDNGGSNNIALWLKGAFTWWWGVEIANSNPDPPQEEAGVNFTSSEGNKLINVVIHDQGSNGINPYTPATNSEIYGCIVYYSGRFNDTARANAYAIYGQNSAPSVKTIADNFLFNSFGIFQAHMTGSSTASLDNFTFEGNVFFGHTLYDNNNVIALLGNFEPGAGKNLNPQWKSNVFYRADLWLGYNGDGVDSAVVTDNLFVRGDFQENPANTYRLMSGNIFSSGMDSVIVRVNRYADVYEPRRANIIVLNARHSSTVRVNLPAGVLIPGDRYQVRDVQNFFGPPVASGVFADTAVVISMPGSGDPITQPRSIPANRPGSSLPAHTDREFGTFVLLANLENVAWPLGVDDRSFPGEYALAQNYPNPCNPTATIDFVLPVRSTVTLAVYNILGQTIRTLVNSPLEAGRHSVKFDGQNLSSGVYFYRLIAGPFSAVKKLLLVH